MKVAIVHEWISSWAGSEKVVEQLLLIYPQADLYSVVDFLPDAERHLLGGRRPATTFIQRLPGARRHFRRYLPLMPLAIEQLELASYDLVLSSNHAVAKGVITGPDQLHLSYVHSPMRYAWDLQAQYLRESDMTHGIKGAVARCILHYLRNWDVRSANGVDAFAANSAFIARRITKVYRRDSTVIHPPVDTSRFQVVTDKEGYFVTASRMVPYKRIPLIVEAFAAMPQHRLVVIGDGPEMPRVRALAAGRPNIEVRGYQSDAELVTALQKARAFVFAAEEDFGIAPVEAMACGTPVIGLGRGGALDSVIDGVTGMFFHEQTAQALASAVGRFMQREGRFDPHACRHRAERFSPEVFRERIRQWVDREWRARRGAGAAPVADHLRLAIPEKGAA